MKLLLAPVLVYMVSMLWVCGSSQHGNIIQWGGVTTYTNGQPCSNCSYAIYRSTDGSNFILYAVQPLSTNYYFDSSVIGSTDYWYKVSAIDLITRKQSSFSNTIKCTTGVSCLSQ